MIRFQTRSDRLSLANFDDRCRELEEIRCECEQTRSLARDHYACETYQYASEESSLTRSLFVQYLHEQNLFHEQIHSFFSTRLPQLESQLNSNPSSPPFGEDLLVHCSKRSNNHSIAYPIEICVHLLEHSLQEEGLFRITPSHLKQKKFVAELNLQLIDKGTTLEELNLDCHVPASTLKQYLRELPNCLLTNQLFQQWNQVATLRSLVNSPHPHRLGDGCSVTDHHPHLLGDGFRVVGHRPKVVGDGREPKIELCLLFLVMKPRVFNASLNYSIVYLLFITRISGSFTLVSFFSILISWDL